MKYYDTIWNMCKRDFKKNSDREIAPSEYWDGGKVPKGEDVSFYWHIGEDS